MGNTKKLFHIPKQRVGQYLFLFDTRYYLKVSLIYCKFLMLERALLWKKKQHFLQQNVIIGMHFTYLQ